MNDGFAAPHVSFAQPAAGLPTDREHSSDPHRRLRGRVRTVPVSFEVRNPFGSVTGAIMADKSPRQSASKKSGKSIKQKRADKKAASAPPGPGDKATAAKSTSPKK